MSANPKIDVSKLLKQDGNTCGAHSIYNYLVITKNPLFKAHPDDPKKDITAIYQAITSSGSGEAALPHLMLRFLNQHGLSVTLHGSNQYARELEEISSQLKIAETISYSDDPFATALPSGAHGIALWNTTENFPPLHKLATMHYTVVYKNATGETYALDSNCPEQG